eukprot:3436102-Pleurochrysis_carterae.AAC.2
MGLPDVPAQHQRELQQANELVSRTCPSFEPRATQEPNICLNTPRTGDTVSPRRSSFTPDMDRCDARLPSPTCTHAIPAPRLPSLNARWALPCRNT